MPIEKMPKNPLPANYVPPGGERIKVGKLAPEEGWGTLAKRRGVDAGRGLENGQAEAGPMNATGRKTSDRR